MNTGKTGSNQQLISQIFLEEQEDLRPRKLRENPSHLGRYTLDGRPVLTSQYTAEDLGTSSDGLSPVPPAGPVDALVFDIYGTLMISASGDISLGEDTSSRESRLMKLLDEYDIDMEPSRLIGQMKDRIIRVHREMQAQGVDYPEVEIRSIWASLEAMEHLGEEDISLFAAEYEALVNPVAPMPGLEKVLNCARAAGIPMGIVSNAQFYTPAMFRAFTGKSLLQLGFHPDLMIFSYQEGFGKPSTVLYKRLAERLERLQHPGHGMRSIPPARCLYVGNDMLKDVWAAAQCGFQTALFAGDARSYRPRQEDVRCSSLQADYVVSKLEDICLLFRS
ncbi:HAD family hydrolase [Salinispira pacifica]|uniref:Putative hydrolase n=1 Tax=Salinispira pacifica TaxID=1307761 RepID=V5WLQ8_9SPIO|nr:HAD family hydrolase [Salinispira pacifica]AHC16545.1 Putative hydrolase [Salinispira pacifica]